MLPNETSAVMSEAATTDSSKVQVKGFFYVGGRISVIWTSIRKRG